MIKVQYYYYREARDAAWLMLKHTGADRMPISVLKICRSLGIKVIYHQLCENELGKCIMLSGRPHILLHENISSQMKRFVCAHELGHIILEHFETGKSFSYTTDDLKNGLESEAETFAMRLVSPACVLWGCRVSSVPEITELCGIEAHYAQKRLQRMNLLYKRNKFLTSKLEKDIYNNFLPFIGEYNSKHFNI